MSAGSRARRSALASFLWALVLLLAGCALPPDPEGFRSDQPSEHYLYVPAGYTPDRTWPVFVGIHGFGGSGVDCWSLWQLYADREGFILVCPSLADASGGWYQREGEQKLVDILNLVASEYDTDPRVYLAGFSAGGQFVQGYANTYADRVKGVAVLSARNFITPAYSTWDIPYLVVVGDRDDPATVLIAEQIASARETSGYKVESLVLSGTGHRVTAEARQAVIEHYRRAWQE